MFFVSAPLIQIRNLIGAGLFTAELDEPEWGIARLCPLPFLQ
jgi:hypothetical protein